MNQVYVFSGSGAPPYGSPFTVVDSWVDWLKQVWVTNLTSMGYTLQEVAWVPTYEAGYVSWPANDGQMVTTAINPLEFPTRDTANKLAQMYATRSPNDGTIIPLVVLELPFLGLGPVVSTAIMRVFVFPNGKHLDVWPLANYYTNNPSDKSNAADSLCKLLIATVYP